MGKKNQFEWTVALTVFALAMIATAFVMGAWWRFSGHGRWEAMDALAAIMLAGSFATGCSHLRSYWRLRPGTDNWTAEDPELQVIGVYVDGDPDAPLTRWWNLWYLKYWGWKTVAVFEAAFDKDNPFYEPFGFHVGFRTYTGKVRYCRNQNFSRIFALKIGYEPVTIFALAPIIQEQPEPREVPIRLVERTTIDAVRKKRVTLY